VRCRRWSICNRIPLSHESIYIYIYIYIYIHIYYIFTNVWMRARGAPTASDLRSDADTWFSSEREQSREICISLPNNQRQHTSRRMRWPTHCASYCAPCQPLLRAFHGMIQSPLPTRAEPKERFRSKRGQLWNVEDF